MPALLKTTQIQEPSSATVNLSLSTSGGVTVGQNLTVTGTSTLSGGLTITGNETASSFIPSSAVVPTNGLYLPNTNSVGLATNSTAALTIDSSQNTTSAGTVVMSSAYTMRNKMINGAMGISQRGSSFSNPANLSLTLDRWKFWGDGSGGTLTISQTALSAGELPPFSYYMRVNQSAGATARTYFRINQAIEGLEQFSAQTITVSFYAKCASGTVASSLRCDRYFGTGGSPSAADNMSFSSGGTPTITTTWTRFTAISTVTSISGKTLGTNNDSYLLVGIDLPTSGTFDVYLTGFQVEYGNIATPFELRQIQQELAMCQRYYYRMNATGVYSRFGIAGVGSASSTTAQANIVNPVPMRVAPTSIDYLNVICYDGSTISSATITLDTTSSSQYVVNVPITTSGMTAYRPIQLCANNTTNSYFGASAEL